MKISALICEFNPLHNGHLYLLDKMRENGATHIIAVMSGNFTQRGEPAIMSKWARTEAALKCGADIVIELPLTCAVSSAERFASGGIHILNSLGCVDELFFGAECNDISKLLSISEYLETTDCSDRIKSAMLDGISYPSAIGNTVESAMGTDFSEIIKSPNNILAVEYINALKRSGSSITPKSIVRTGAEHDSNTVWDKFASASYIRSAMLKGWDFSSFVPDECKKIIDREIMLGRAPADLKGLERTLIIKLRSMSTDEIKDLPDVSEGIENRIKQAADELSGYSDIADVIKTKRYTHARIRRILLCAVLGITRDMQCVLPEYIRVLGFNSNGEEIMSVIKKNCPYPIITRPVQESKLLNDTQKNLLKKDIISGNIYNAVMPTINKGFDDYTVGCVKATPHNSGVRIAK